MATLTVTYHLIESATEAGLQLTVDDGALKIRGPRDAVAVARRLRKSEAAVIAWLSATCATCGNPLRLPECQEDGRCLACLPKEQYSATVKRVGHRHRAERTWSAA